MSEHATREASITSLDDIMAYIDQGASVYRM